MGPVPSVCKLGRGVAPRRPGAPRAARALPLFKECPGGARDSRSAPCGAALIISITLQASGWGANGVYGCSHEQGQGTGSGDAPSGT
eukprot:scaffold3841_cov412-Prasinococcus_capsulatus_cf.AAC.11